LRNNYFSFPNLQKNGLLDNLKKTLKDSDSYQDKDILKIYVGLCIFRQMLDKILYMEKQILKYFYIKYQNQIKPFNKNLANYYYKQSKNYNIIRDRFVTSRNNLLKLGDEFLKVCGLTPNHLNYYRKLILAVCNWDPDIFHRAIEAVYWNYQDDDVNKMQSASDDIMNTGFYPAASQPAVQVQPVQLNPFLLLMAHPQQEVRHGHQRPRRSQGIRSI
jgi:hypothetical protein